MAFYEGQIVDKKDFINRGGFAKEAYEGLLLASDATLSGYHVGIQLSENRVLVVDRTNAEDVHEALEHWGPRVDAIQREHKVNRDPGIHATDYGNKPSQ